MNFLGKLKVSPDSESKQMENDYSRGKEDRKDSNNVSAHVYPQMVVLLGDTSASMNKPRISEVGQCIESQIHKSEIVVLYTMDTTCFQPTKCLTNKEFIKQTNKYINFRYLWDTSDIIKGVVKPSSDYPHFGGVTETDYNCVPKPLCDKLTRSKYCRDYSNGCKISLNSFCCFSFTNICDGLTCIFNECLDIMTNDNPNGYDVYLLFSTDVLIKDGKVRNAPAQIEPWSKLLQQVKQKAMKNRNDFVWERHIISDTNNGNNNNNNNGKQRQDR